MTDRSRPLGRALSRFFRWLCLASLLASTGLMDDRSFAGGSQETEDWSLPSTTGERQNLRGAEGTKWRVVCFLGVDCPLAKLYGPRLQSLSDRYQNEGVAFIGVNSNLQDSMAELKSYQDKCGVRFPMVKDYDQKLANRLQADRTPEVFLLDDRFNVRYRGRIDDQYLPGIVKPVATSNELRDAIESVLKGEDPKVKRSEPVGCLIGRKKQNRLDADITYCKQVARIFQNRCVECHRIGEIGPFAMTEYEELLGWGDMILEVVEQGRMPPWHARDGHVPIANARQMPNDEKKVLREWIESGMPFGEPKDLPEPLIYPTEWRLSREPDRVVAMARTPYSVPAEGTVEYQYFVVDPELNEDRWVAEAQVLPGNASVVHHAIVFIRPPDGSPFRGVGWLTAYVPGQRQMRFPPGTARKIPAGSKLVFQMHYTPNGRPQEDLTQVGLVFTDEAGVTDEVLTLIGIDQEFEIPPHAKDHRVRAKVRWLPEGGKLLAIAPHMHVRGKAFEVFARTEEGTRTLLEVPRYDFNWQHTYELQEPLPLQSMKSLEIEAAFDNSKENPVNPNPDEFVFWGDQTWEEMAVAFFEVSVPRSPPKEEKPRQVETERGRNEGRNGDAARESTTKSQQFADDFLKKLDRNGDGVVTFGEAPVVMQRFSFWRFDKNRDNRIDRSELLEAGK